MRSEQLQYVAAIARLGSFRRAAEELHISQPALSATVRNLERELGVNLLDRDRTGAQMSARGRDLLPHITTAIDAVETLRRAASKNLDEAAIVRVGTVSSAGVTLLTAAAVSFRALHPITQVEVIRAQHAALEGALRDRSLDLCLTTCLDGDKLPADLETVELLRGRVVVCVSAASPLAALDKISVEQLLEEPLVMMRDGYLMHRYVQGILAGRTPNVSYTTDGAEIGKLMVAEGVGVCVLPEFSVASDPLVRRGAITWRPLRDGNTSVLLVLRRPRAKSRAEQVDDLHRLLVEQAPPRVPNIVTAVDAAA